MTAQIIRGLRRELPGLRGARRIDDKQVPQSGCCQDIDAHPPAEVNIAPAQRKGAEYPKLEVEAACPCAHEAVEPRHQGIDETGPPELNDLGQLRRCESLERPASAAQKVQRARAAGRVEQQC